MTICIHISIHTIMCIYTYIHKYIHISLSLYIYICKHMQIYVRTRAGCLRTGDGLAIGESVARRPRTAHAQRSGIIIETVLS